MVSATLSHITSDSTRMAASPMIATTERPMRVK
jgi:hypothetical protein